MQDLLVTPWASVPPWAPVTAGVGAPGPLVTCCPPLAVVPVAGGTPAEVALYALGVPWVEAAPALDCCLPVLDALPVLATAVAVPRPRVATGVPLPLR